MLSQETSTQTGTYSFTIRVTDYDNKFFDKIFSITVIVVYPFTGSSEWNTAAQEQQPYTAQYHYYQHESDY